MNYRISSALCVIAMTLTSLQAHAQTFSYTGSPQTYTVPAGVSQIQIEAWGASGGGSSGGAGGYATGLLDVTPGQQLYIYVGQQGQTSGDDEGSGGGASDVRTVGGNWYDPTSLNSRLIVGAGGGGSGSAGGGVGIGGAGGGDTGTDGSWNDDSQGTQFGLGATQISGGGFDVGDEGDENCLGAMEGAFGYGGDARYFGRGDTCTDVEFYNGQDPWDYRATFGAFNGGGTYDVRGLESGGGGGGWYGGGAPGSGDFGGGGGGGSSYIGGVLSGSTTSGLRVGDGEVIITVTAQQAVEPEPVPAMSFWSLGILSGMISFLALYYRRRK
ncbi:glycine-rich protein [Haliea atlantica]